MASFLDGLSGLAGAHSFLLSTAIAFLAFLTALSLFERGKSHAAHQWSANAAAATVLGCGAWVAYFIEVGGLDSSFVLQHDVWATFATLICLLAAAMGALAFASRTKQDLRRAGAGALIGLSFIASKTTLVTTHPGVDGGQVIAGLFPLIAATVLGATSFVMAGRLSGVKGVIVGTLALTLSHGLALNIGWIRHLEVTPGSAPYSFHPSIAVGLVTACAIVVSFALMLMRMERRLDRTEHEISHLRMFSDTAFDGIVLMREGVIVETNSSFAHLLSRPQKALPGTRLDSLLYGDATLAGLNYAISEPLEVTFMRGDRMPQPVEILARPFPINGVPHQVLAVRDAQPRKLAEARTQATSLLDPVTQLSNRMHFRERLAQELNRATRNGDKLAIICIDLDRFKEVNDGFGHAAGDRLLQLAAKRIRDTFRSYDVVGRLGGDEFAVVQCASHQPGAALAVSRRLIQAMREPFDVDGVLVTIGASAGVAMFPIDGQTVDELLARADLALLRAKEEGRNTFRMFEPRMDAELQERRSLARELRMAIENDEIMLHYQPIADLRSGAVVGFEALARWQHAERGWISPTSFIPLAEELGLMSELGARMLQQACAEAARWKPDLRVSVNLAPTQVQDAGLVDFVARVLADSGLPAKRLHLEITERALKNGHERALLTMRALKNLGVSLVMDDFGTGHSSLATLRACPIDRIKMDESFVCGMAPNSDAAALAKAISGIGGALTIPVSAVGVENAQQAELLLREGCGEAQGVHYGAPMPISAFAHITGVSANRPELVAKAV